MAVRPVITSWSSCSIAVLEVARGASATEETCSTHRLLLRWVLAERDVRAWHRAVARWANDNTADLRRLAGVGEHLEPAGQIDTATSRTDEIRWRTQRRRDDGRDRQPDLGRGETSDHISA